MDERYEEVDELTIQDLNNPLLCKPCLKREDLKVPVKSVRKGTALPRHSLRPKTVTVYRCPRCKHEWSYV